MDKTTQDLAWRVLPKEFKEEVKETYREYTEKIATTSEPEYRIVGYIAAQTELELLFGKHNLTSDAMEEEMLICEKSKVQRAYNTSREIVKAENPDTLMYSMHTQIMCVLESIFGSKCLPEEDAHEYNFATKKPQPAEPKFKIGDKVRVKFNAKELHSNPDPSKNIYYWQTARDKYLGKVFKIIDIWKSGTITLNTAEVMFWEPFDLEPYTEPKKIKKKHRIAAHNAILMVMAIITAPISLLGIIGEGLRWLWDYTVLKPMYWYFDKFIINDNDPD